MTQKNTLKNITNKVRISGNVIEILTYKKGYFTGYQTVNKIGRASRNVSTEEKIQNHKINMTRASSRVRNLANANPQLNKFFTLTFAENVTDIKFANNEFNKFIKRLNRYSLKKCLTHKFQYIAVVEFQKRGAIHYHILCNLPYIPKKELATLWGNGFVKINKIDNVDNVGAYITKYMTKDNDDTRLMEHRSFFTSQGLKQPIEILNSEVSTDIYNIILCGDFKIKKEPYYTTFENEYLGQIEYTQIVLDRPFNYHL